MKFDSTMKWSREIFESPKNQEGFSLIELIMVIIFISVAFVATMSMMSSGIEKSVESEALTRATMLAEEKMEQIRGDKNTEGYHYLKNENYPQETNAGGNQGYTRIVQISNYATYKEIKVIVKHASIQDVVLVTHLTNY